MEQLPENARYVCLGVSQHISLPSCFLSVEIVCWEPREGVLIHTELSSCLLHVCREPPICVMTSRSQEWGEPRRGGTGCSTSLKKKKKPACIPASRGVLLVPQCLPLP